MFLTPFCLAGCPIYTPAEVVADTLVHVVGLPFGFGASYIMLEEVHARLPQVCARLLRTRSASSRCAGRPGCTVLLHPCARRSAMIGVRYTRAGNTHLTRDPL